MIRVRVRVFPRREVLDPQGRAMRDALKRLGFGGVADVRAGKSFVLDVEAKDAAAAEEQVRAMCEKLLYNPVVEEYAIDGAEELDA